MESRKVATVDVVQDPSLQPRAEPRNDVVSEYADAVRNGTEFPPLRVCLVAGRLLLIDGYHRHAAYLATGLEWCRVEVVETCDLARAQWLAAGANASHGLRRTNADKRRAVELAFQATDRYMSHREVARHVGVTHPFVGDVWAEIQRRDVVTVSTSPEIANDSAKPAARKDSLGRLQPASKPERQKDSTKVLDVASSEPEWTPPAPKAPKVEPRTTAEPIPDGAPLLRAADVLRAARLAVGDILPADVFGRVELALRREEGLLRSGVAVVCDECNGKGCPGCQRRGWRPASQNATEMRRAK